MNPQIVHPEGNPNESWLIDLHSVVTTPTETGELGKVALRAIDIINLRAGQFDVIDGRRYPSPCQLFAWERMTSHDPLWRGIFPDAAVALLTMPHGMKTSVEPGKPLALGPTATGLNEWSFRIAWCWSRWQDLYRKSGNKDWQLETRWQSMKELGYPDTFAAFRQICSRLKLSVTKSAPYM